ncbi:MAG TPA: hypothetical protein VGQ15_07375 [Gaiellaceae bacterium]|jgi:hypothetical protein|nr:hypothetical protein [Gaiellaceae bacterium]
MPADDETRVEELPPDETGPVPVTRVEAEPRWYGITPRGGAVAVGVAAAGVGIVLLVLGSIVAGAILLALGALVLGMLVRGPVASALSGPTERGRTAVSTRLAAGRRLAELRRELDAVAGDRDRRLRALGEAVYRGDEAAVGPLRAELVELDRRATEIREQIDRTVLEARERMSSARLETARTQVVRSEQSGPAEDKQQ